MLQVPLHCRNSNKKHGPVATPDISVLTIYLYFPKNYNFGAYFLRTLSYAFAQLFLLEKRIIPFVNSVSIHILALPKLIGQWRDKRTLS